MKFSPTKLPGVVLVEPDVHKDARGFFFESYHQEKYSAGGIPGPFVQDNHSRSVEGALRGLHAQIKQPQGKLIRVVSGEVYDVAVDIRRGSPTFGQWVGVLLSSENFRQLYIPPGFAHGFCVTSKIAEVEYKCTDFYDPADEITVIWNDPKLSIDWPIRKPLLSAKDLAGKPLAQLAQRLPTFR